MKTKTRYIPEGYVKYLDTANPNQLFEAYVHKEKPVAMFFIGKQSKPAWHYRFGDNFKMKDKLDKSISSLVAREVTKTERKAKLSAPHTLQEGDILVASWGYDQTNVNYFQVTSVPSKHFVEVKEIGQVAVAGTDAFMSCQVMPVKDNFKKGWLLQGEAKRFKVSGDSVKVKDSITASKWGGQSNYCSWYA